MSADPRRVKELFVAALDVADLGDRDAFVDRECGADADLRHRLAALLRAHEHPESALERPLGTAANPYTASHRSERVREAVGSFVVGRYKLLELLGAGGMGEVWVADQQEPMKRRVALKLIKAGMDSRGVLARFEAERQALALMDHPNIAKVLDAGTTTDGRPYFAMELVKGTPITEFCDARKLTAKQRLELFTPVCQAIQHAHMKGIIHRDIKPGNVLVALHDETPVPKVIDFGVAKAIGQQLTEKTIYTGFGSLIGTPAYMAPEQATFNQLDVDTRADVYALGVLLYELLAGTPPIEKERLKQAALDEVLRIVREEEPARPSQRLSTSQSKATIAATRQSDPARLSALMKGDLDWIVMKALEKDRSRRYETANALAADVQRYLSGEPVQAHPPTFGYRLKKLVRKHRGPVAAAAVVVVALVVGVVGTAWQAIRATSAEGAARASEQTARDEKEAAIAARQEAEARSEQLRRFTYIADINLAKQAWDSNNLRRLQQLLDRHIPRPGETDLRKFEWYYLSRLPHRELYTLGPDRWDKDVAWSPDGKRIYSFGLKDAPRTLEIVEEVGEIRCWDVASRKLIPLTLEGGSSHVVSGALSDDGQVIAAGCNDGKVRLWHLPDGKLTVLEGHTGKTVLSVEFSHDGNKLASNCVSEELDVNSFAKSEIVVWDVARSTKIVQRKLGAHVWRPSLSPDGKRLAYQSDNKLTIVNTDTDQVVLENENGVLVDTLEYSPDGARLAGSGVSADVHILDATTGKLLRTCSAPVATRVKLCFSKDGKSLYASGFKNGMEQWDTETGRIVRTWKGHVDMTNGIALNPDGSLLASAGHGGVKVWDAVHDPDVRTLPLDGQKRIELSPNGRVALTGTNDQTVQLWDAATGARKGPPLTMPTTLTQLDFTLDGRTLFLTDRGGNVDVWDLATFRKRREWRNDDQALTPWTDISAGGKYYFHQSNMKSVKMRDVETGATIREFPLNSTKDWFFFGVSSDGGRIVLTSPDGFMRLLETATGREVWATQFNTELREAHFSTDGTRLGCWTPRGVSILDSATGRELSVLNDRNVFAFVFNPAGDRMATSGTDGVVRLWDIASGQELLTLTGHTNQVTSLAFTGDGRQLLSAGRDRSIRIWDATPLSEPQK